MFNIVLKAKRQSESKKKDQNFEGHLERHLFKGDGVLLVLWRGYSLCIVSVLDNITKISIQVSACFPFLSLPSLTLHGRQFFFLAVSCSWRDLVRMKRERCTHGGLYHQCSWYNFQMTIRHTDSTELTLSQNQMGSGQHWLTWLERLRHKIESKFKNGHDHGQIPFVIPWGLVRLSERHTNSSTKLHRTILDCWRPVQLDQMKKFTIYNVTVSLDGLWILEKSSNRDV